MLKFRLFFLITFIFLQPSFAFSETIKYININHIMNKSKAGVYIIEQLNKENKTLLVNFKSQEDKFKKQETTIINQKNILEKSEFEKKIVFLKKEITLYNKDKILKLKNLERKKIKAQSKLIDNINTIMIEYMDKNSISLILRKETLFVGKKELDITNQILLSVDNKIKKIDIK